MKKCPKCSQRFDDFEKICRVCGKFLEPAGEESVLREETPQTPIKADEPPPPFDGPPWQCAKCQQHVPGSFQVCWNCGTSREGTPDPTFAKTLTDESTVETEAESRRETVQPSNLSCAKCGSTKVIPQATVLDQGRGSDGYLQVVVYGDPQALIFKDRLYGPLTVDICGDCGHVEWRVTNAEELYDHYRQASK